MAPTYRAVSSAASALSSFTAPKPTGTATGDVLVAVLTATSAMGSMGTPTGGATWQLLEEYEGTAISGKAWWKVAGGSEPSTYGFTKDANAGTVIIVAVPGGAATAPVVAATGEFVGSTTAIATPSIIPTRSDDLEIRVAGFMRDGGSGSITFTPPSTYTARVTVGTSGTDVFSTLATKSLSSSSATGSQNFTASTTPFDEIGFTIAITTGSVDATVALGGSVNATSSVPAPAVSAGANISAAPVLATASIPTPGISAGQSIPASPVTATSSIPAPSVTTDEVEIVPLATVTATSSIPAPTVSASAAATLAPVLALAVIPTPAISADFNANISLVTVVAVAIIPLPVVGVPILPGDQITGNYQIEYGGLLFGGYGNPYQIIAGSLEGWGDLPSLDSGSVTRPNRHGTWAGRRLAQERQVSVVIATDANGDFTGALNALRLAITPRDDETEVPLVVSGRDEVLLAYAAVDARVQPTRDYSTGWVPVSIRWVCSDPRLYNVVQSGISIPVDSAVDVANAGNVATHPVIRVFGPAVNPEISNGALDRMLAFSITLDAGEILEIDTDNGTATVSGENVMSTLTGASAPVADFVFARGVNPITYTADSGGATPATALWRDAWL